MNLFKRFKRVAIVGLTTILIAIGASLATAGAAQAEPASTQATSSALMPNVTSYCNGKYLCMDGPIVHDGNYIIRDWTPDNTFVGHYELQTPQNKTYNSKSKLNHIGAGNGWDFTVPRVHGKYCSTAWKDSSATKHTKLGYVCYEV